MNSKGVPQPSNIDAQLQSFPEPAFATDRPIHSASEDVLGRNAFVGSLANALIRWQGADSLVVAIYGPWGSGKTSVKNMLLEHLRSAVPPPHVVEFNPWAWSGQDRLLPAFFSEIGAALGKSLQTEESKEVVEKWRKYGRRLATGGKILGGLQKLTEFFGIPVLPTVLGRAAEGSTAASELAEGRAQRHEAELEEDSAEQLKQALAEALGGQDRPLLVVMDDVDRLTTEEIRLLFQLVKVNADFPKVVYLLAFDRAIVEKALSDVSGCSGRDYMEKIVQVGFDLPRPAQADLDQAICRGLDQLLSFEGVTRHFDQQRWANIYTFGIRPIVRTLRDVRRFLSSFSFTLGLFHCNKTLEANPLDLIGIEVLRLFEPAVFHRLPDEKKFLVGTEMDYLGHEKQRSERRKQRFNAVLELSSIENREAVEVILGELFPELGWLRRGMGRGIGFEEGWLRTLRICTEDFFDRYFAFAVPQGDVPQSVLDSIIRIGKDREKVRDAFQKLGAQGLLVKVLDRLEAYKTVLDLEMAEAFITAMFDVADSLPEGTPSFFGISPDLTVCRIIYHFLRREKDVKRRGAVLLRAIEQTDGLYVPVYKVSLERDREDGAGARNESIFDDEDLARAKAICVSKITAASRTDRLLGPRLGYLLWRWREWEHEGPPREYARRLTTTTTGCLQLLTGFIYEIRSSSMEGGAIRSRWELRLKSVEPFVEIDILQRQLQRLLDEPEASEHAALASQYARELGAFGRALKRRKDGKPDDGGVHDYPEDEE